MLGKPFQPMEPVRWPAPFDHPDWLFQPKWDGVRILAHVDGTDLRLFNRRGHDRTVQYPEILAGLRAGFSGKSAVFDGEAVVFRENRPSFPRIMQRELALRDAAIAALQRSLPATYMVFDLVYLNGRELVGMGFEERQELLRKHLLPGEAVLVTDSYAQGSLLFAAVKERGWEGVVAKRRVSPYRLGKSAYWRKIKVRRRQLCAVGGFTLTARGVGALLLGAYRDGDLVYIGRAASGLAEEELRVLAPYLAQTVQQQCPFSPAPRLAGTAVRWVRPTLTALVEYSEWTEGLHLRHPVILRFTADPVSACRLP